MTLTCDENVMASALQLPVSVESFKGMSLDVGVGVFVGQYLFTGSETTSAYLTVTEVWISLGVVFGVLCGGGG